MIPRARSQWGRSDLPPHIEAWHDFPLPSRKTRFKMGISMALQVGFIPWAQLHLQPSAHSAFHTPNPELGSSTEKGRELGKMAMLGVMSPWLDMSKSMIHWERMIKYPLFMVYPLFDAYKSSPCREAQIQWPPPSFHQGTEVVPHWWCNRPGQNMVLRGHASHVGNP